VWAGFALMTQIIAGIRFMLVGIAQLMVWVRAKHRQSLKEFGTLYPWMRKRMLPFVW